MTDDLTPIVQTDIIDPDELVDQAEAELREKMSEDGKFEVRKLITEEGGVAFFPFYIIDSAEKWEKASDLQCKRNLEIGDRQMRVTARCVALKDQEMLEIKYEIPQWSNPLKEETKDFKERRAKMESMRTIAFLELGLGHSVPGDSDDEKIEWLNQMSPSQIEGMEVFINSFLCCLSDGWAHQEYEAISMRAQKEESAVEDFVDFSSWSKATDCKYTVRFARPFQHYIIEVPLRAISRSVKAQVEEECVTPTAPKRPKLDETGRPTREMEPNFDDPKWKKQNRAVEQKKTAMLFEAALPFKIPGEGYAEKYEWICSHTAGDVLRIKNFIEAEILQYGRALDFFTNAFGQ